MGRLKKGTLPPAVFTDRQVKLLSPSVETISISVNMIPQPVVRNMAESLLTWRFLTIYGKTSYSKSLDSKQNNIFDHAAAAAWQRPTELIIDCGFGRIA